MIKTKRQLIGCKIIINSAEESIMVQKKALSLGMIWVSNSTEILTERNIGAIYFDGGGMSYSPGVNTSETFSNENTKEITIKDLFTEKELNILRL